MPNLPQIFAQPSLPSVQAVRVPRGAFGETFGAELEHAAGKLFEAQQLLETQTALDKRDELYQQRKMDMMQNPQKYAEMSYPEFIKQFQEGAKADDQAVMQDSSFFIRHHLSPLFARVQRHQFDQMSTEYHRLWQDNARGQTINSINEDMRHLATAKTDQEREFYQDSADTKLRLAGSTGVFSQQEVANKRESFDNEVQQYKAVNLIQHDPQGLIDNIDAPEFDQLKPTQKREFLDSAYKARDSNYNAQDQTSKALHAIVVRDLGEGISQGRITSADLLKAINPASPLGINRSEYDVLVGDAKKGPYGAGSPEANKAIDLQISLATDLNQALKALDEAQKNALAHPLDEGAISTMNKARANVDRITRGDHLGVEASRARKAVTAFKFRDRTVRDWYFNESPLDKKLNKLIDGDKKEVLADVLNTMDDEILNRGVDPNTAIERAEKKIIEDLQKADDGLNKGEGLRQGTQKYKRN